MSRENVDQYHRLAEAYATRDLDAFLAFFDPEAEFAPRSIELDSDRPYLGHDGIRAWWESWFGAFSDYRAEIDEVEDLGGVTFSRVRLSARGIGSAAPLEQTQWHVVEWRDARISRWRTLRSEAEARETARLWA